MANVRGVNKSNERSDNGERCQVECVALALKSAVNTTAKKGQIIQYVTIVTIAILSIPSEHINLDFSESTFVG